MTAISSLSALGTRNAWTADQVIDAFLCFLRRGGGGPNLIDSIFKETYKSQVNLFN